MLSLGYPVGGYYQLQLSTTTLHDPHDPPPGLPGLPWHEDLWDPPPLCELTPSGIRVVQHAEARKRWAHQHRLLGPRFRDLLAARRRADLLDRPKPRYRRGVHYSCTWMPPP